MKKREPFLNGLPELLVLRLIAQREMYGYELVAKISLVSKNALRFGEGCIYPVLHRMVGEGLLLTRRTEVQGRPRYYYRLSSSGRNQLVEHDRRWAEICHAVEAAKSPGALL